MSTATALLSSEELSAVLPYALGHLYSNGGIFLSSSRAPNDGVIHAPFSLLPWHFPQGLLNQGLSLAIPFNNLVDSVSRDSAWLLGALERTAGADSFTGRLVDMYRLELAREAEAVKAGGGPVQNPLRLGIHRSDYMLTSNSEDSKGDFFLKQVELNTVASSMAGLSSIVSQLHANLPLRFASELPNVFKYFSQDGTSFSGARPSTANRDLAFALKEAHFAYLKGYSGGAPPPGILVAVCMVVQPGERNSFDQRALESELWDRYGVVLRYATLAELGRVAPHPPAPSHGILHNHASAPPLFLPPRGPGGPCTEVSVVYYRAGYTPGDYPSELEWTGRDFVEASRAIKCPCLAYHLAGTKKVQQLLANPGVLERFVKEKESVASLRGCFAGLWSLDVREGGDVSGAIEAARKNPSHYVIKPQREGGGNNLFNDSVAGALRIEGGMPPDQLAGYILMERLFPPLKPCVFVRNGAVKQSMGSCELGVYGVFLGDGVAPPLLNLPAGTLLRTKLEGSDEGGVAAGFAVIDSVWAV